MYAENFGEFFEDQVRMADAVVFSRCDLFPERVADARQAIQRLNPMVPLFSEPWDQIPADRILASESLNGNGKKPRFSVSFGKSTLDETLSQVYTPGFEKDHHHSAEAVFDTITIETEKIFNKAKLSAQMSALTDDANGFVVRAKGILPVDGGFVNLQYLPGDLSITDCETEGGVLSIIGQNLNRQEITRLFQEE